MSTHTRSSHGASNSRIAFLYQSAKKQAKRVSNPSQAVEGELRMDVAVPIKTEVVATKPGSLHALTQQNQHKKKVFTEDQQFPDDLLPYPANDDSIWINPQYRQAP